MNLPKIDLPKLELPRHYPTPGARLADLIVHLTGLVLALFGGGVLLGLSVARGDVGLIAGLMVYAVGLLAMLGFSTAYNFASPRWQPTLRRLDHAGIFLMIAGSYTPFTTQRFEDPVWSIGFTALVWVLALGGVVAKLFAPRLNDVFWSVVYVIFGWLAVVAIQPMVTGVSPIALGLLVAGGLIYTLGCFIFVRQGLPFRRAIWHGFVVAGAGAHYAAVMVGVVFAAQ